MTLPICCFDAKNAVLCTQCEGKVDTGVLTQADVDASMILAKIAKSNKEIENFTLHSCKEFDGNFVLSLAKNDIMGIRQSRTMYRILQDQFKGKIWLEIMLIKGINDNLEYMKKFKEVIERINPDKVQLNVPSRPPSESWVKIPSLQKLKKTQSLLGKDCELI